MKQAGDSLAGRAETIELFPLSQGELERREQPEDFVTWLLSGSAAGESEALDTTAALSAQLTGFTAAQAASVGGREYWGLLVEQFVGLELAKQRGWSATDFTLHHYRDHDGLELDLLLELADGRLSPLRSRVPPP